METFICSCCGYLVIFRVYRGNRHQPIHLPTGWPCWKMRQQGECSEPEPIPFPTTDDMTGESNWKPFVDRAVKSYRRYQKDKRMAPLLELIKGELSAGHVTRVQYMIEELLYKFSSSRERTSLIQQVVHSDEWLLMAERARQEAERGA